MTLIIPPGKKTGCLPRVTRFGDCCAPMADSIEVIPRDQWAEIIAANPDLNARNHVKKIKDQDGIGACATFSTAQGTEMIRSMSGVEWVELNPFSIYRVTSHGRDQGSSIDENLEFARDIGILPESYWPQSKGWRATPPDGWEQVAASFRIHEFYDIGTVDEVGTALLNALPVVFGWRGHSCVLVGLKSPTEAEYANSWKETWGDKGFGTINLNEINFRYGAFAVRSVSISNDDDPLPPLPEAV